MDSIQFDYGIQVEHHDSLPNIPSITCDKIEPKKAIKATYYGYHDSSQVAWYTLLEYANRRNISIENKIIEIYDHDSIET